MNVNLKSSLWHQFEAAIDMLENALVACQKSRSHLPDRSKGKLHP